MPDYYLVRRNLETIVGPMTLKEFKDKFEHMEFGLQDEISSHCSKWIFLEDAKKLKVYYPSVYKYIFSDLRTWTDQMNQKVNLSSKKKPSKKKSKIAKRMWMVFLGVVFLISMLVWHNRAYLYQEFQASTDDTQIDLVEVKNFYDGGQFDQLDAYMRSYEAQIARKANSAEAKDWLPYIRWFVYFKGGNMDDVSAQTLKGEEAELNNTPVDCSFNSWKYRFQESIRDWRAIFSGQELPKAHWSRILAWDPHWIKRRPSEGWLQPSNYYGGCVFMALQGFLVLSEEQDFVALVDSVYPNEAGRYLNTIKNRLLWLSHVVNGTEKPSQSVLRRRSIDLERLTCYESSMTHEGLKKCLNLPASEDDWYKYMYGRFSNNSLRLILQNRTYNKLAADAFEMKDQLITVDSLTRLDFSAEHYFLNIFENTGFDFDTSIEKTSLAHPDVDLLK